MMKNVCVLKIENGEVQSIYSGEWSLELSKIIHPVSNHSLDFILKELQKTEPVLMSRGEPTLPHEIHRICDISNAKPEAKFTIRLVEIDLIGNKVNVRDEWNYDVKQWPEGHIKITKVIK